MTLLQIAKTVLSQSKDPLRPQEIWKMAVRKGYDKLNGGKGKTPGSTIRYMLYVSMRDDKNSPFGITDTFPRRFYLKNTKGRKPGH